MADWLVWLIVAGVLGVAEVVSLTLVLGMVSVAAVAAALVAVLGVGPAGQVATFAIVSVLLLGFVRPVARRHRNMPPGLQTGTAALVGRRGLAVTDVDHLGGQVRIGGEVWSARSYDDDQPVPAGSPVHVIEIDGATAVVLPWEAS